MSLASRQIIKEANKIAEKKLKSGFIPMADLMFSELNKFYKVTTPGTPSFKMRKQIYRGQWDVDAYNKNLQEIYDDLNNLYEEIVQQFTTVLVDFDYNDTERRRIMHEIKEVDGMINDLLLLASDTEGGYLYSVHDSFIDRSKIDLAYTTCEINTDAGTITLKESKNGIKKVDLSHYYDVEQYPILALPEYAVNIVSNKLFPGSKFGYAFSDVNTAWSQKITTSTPGKLEVFFLIEMAPGSQENTYVSRIELQGQFSKPAMVEPYWSIDNINYVALPIGHGSRRKVVANNKTQVWNFPEVGVRYLKFLVSMDEQSESIGTSGAPQYIYTMGFKKLSVFQAAYIPESILYSKKYEVNDPTGEAITIDKVTLVTVQDIPVSTNIEHFVSLGAPSGVYNLSPEDYDWAPISPINDPNPAEAQLVDFRHVAFLNNLPMLQWDSTSYGTPVLSENGVDFYQIYKFPYEPVKDSVNMYRGLNNWQKKVTYNIERKAVYNESHTFAAGNTGTESSRLIYPNFSPVAGEGLIRGSVKVKSTAGTNPDVIYTTPNDYVVNYDTCTITRKRDSQIRSDGATIYVDYQYDNETIKPDVFTTYIYVLNPNGVDINLVSYNSAQMEAGQFLIMSTSEGDINLSSLNNYHIPPGWHKIQTTSEPRTANDRFYSVNNNKYLEDLVYKMYAYGEKLQEVSWFQLRNTIKKLDHTKYCIYDYDGDGKKEILVNYRPQTAKWASVSDDLLNPLATPETYQLDYKYIATINNVIYYKAKLSRTAGSAPDITPTLYEYTIKIGY